jgi:nicotinamidase-related amidase
MTTTAETILVTAHTALVLIDLQAFTAYLPTAPLPATEVVCNAARLAKACRTAGVLVVQVNATLGVGGGVALANPPSDLPAPTAALPDGWDAIPAELGPDPADVVVAKWGWDGFHGTDLDLQLRRRGIDTIILGGIATNVGVESSARSAREHGYRQIFAADLLSAFTEAEHTTTLAMFARIGHVRTVRQIEDALR